MGETAKEIEDPWVCPNDRELSLRAKLKSGWSFYTNKQQTGYGKKFSIKEEEREVIENVIKKSEEITLREEYRIGCLVDRLENIKNNAKGNGVTTCLLCDEKFGKISTSPMKCNVCGKAACSKCGVDTISSRNIPIWLCKLCNEQREFWKKSGAWFFRKMPQHKLPLTRERSTYLTSGSFVVSTPELNRKSNLLSQVSELYSDSDQESSLSSEEILEEDRGHALKRHRAVESTDSVDGSILRQNSSTKTAEADSLSQYRPSRQSWSDRRNGSRQNSFDTSDEESRRSRILQRSPLSVRRKKRPSVSSISSRQSDSLTVASSNGEERILDNGTIPFGEVVNSEKNLEEIFRTYGKDYKLEGPLGVLEFTVNYLKDIKRLDVHIHDAKGLRAMDSTGTSDPYVKIHLLPGASKSNKTRTHTHHKTLNPVFDEILTYHGITEEDMKTKMLRLQVLDEDRLSRNDFIGQTTVALKQVLLINNQKMQKILEPKSEAEFSEMPSADSPGRINISLRYRTKDEKLEVGVIRCANLAAMDSNGYSDPYVKCYLLPDPTKKTKRRTKVKKKNLNPEFNETFIYKIPRSELAKKTLEVTVWDHDVGKSNDFIGGVHLGIHSKDSLLKQWFETLKYLNKETKYWHILTRDITLHEAE